METDIFGVVCRYSRKNKNAIAEYIRNQLHEDQQYEQMTMKEYVDPFSGKQVEGNKK